MIFSKVEAEFSAFLLENGFELKKSVVADGKLHRDHIQGHSAGSLNAAYTLHADGIPNGWFEDHKSKIELKWKANVPKKTLTPDERRKFREEQEKRKTAAIVVERANRQQAADDAKEIWKNAKPVMAQKDHAYLVSRNIQPHNCRMAKGALLQPIYNAVKELVNLQRIYPDGAKRFLKNAEKRVAMAY